MRWIGRLREIHLAADLSWREFFRSTLVALVLPSLVKNVMSEEVIEFDNKFNNLYVYVQKFESMDISLLVYKYSI